MTRRSPNSSRLVHFVSLVALAGALLLPSAAMALVQDGQAWFLATAHGSIGGNWKLYLEAQPRVGGGPSEDGIQQLLLRPAIGYQITPTWSLWQGYAWTPSFHPDKDENRIYQQSLVETPREILPVSLVNRTRLEERWIQGASNVSFRLRHMLKAVYPLTDDGVWALVGYDELFVNLDSSKGGPSSGFNQNRVFFGVDYVVMEGVKLEVGYMNQYLHASGKEDGMNHNGVMQIDYAW